MGSALVGGWVARIVFLALLVIGGTSGELGLRGIASFLVLGAAVWMGLPYLPRGADFVTPAIAVIDLVLVLLVFKGDIRIT
ncbi:MAG TPA: hypothetical protein VIY56_12515 [Vicinamibacterales bacterium]